MLAPDTILQNRYLIIRHLSRGGMGAVYLVKHQRLGKTFALKETFFSDDEVLRRAFEREAQLLANLDHPVLPKVTDHFTEGDSTFILMEYIPGEDLGAQLRQNGKPFAVDEVLDWADQLLDALEYLHTNEPPIIHRDIKPENLKLTPRGQIILLDFGLAKGATAEMSHLSRSVFGYTPNYAPLEQVQGEGTDARSDLYSLAATIYHLLTGELPPRVTTRIAAVADGNLDPLRPANEVNPQVTPSIAAVLTQAMARNREQRPASAAAMREALRVARQSTVLMTPARQAPPAPAPIALPPTELSVEPIITPPPTVPSEPASVVARQVSEAQAAPKPSRSFDSASPLVEDTSSVLLSAPAKRRSKLWLSVGVVICLIVLVIAATLGPHTGKDDSGNKQPETTRTVPGSSAWPPLKTFQFDTVKVDAQGKVTERSKGQAQFFNEDIGNGVQLEMVQMPAGTFMMGSPNNEAERGGNEGPQHRVTVPAFYMGKYEVTQAQWRAVAQLPKVNIDLNPDPSYFKGDTLPVESISWDEAKEFCARLSKATGREYRLPSEAEWEYACRAGTTTPFAFGETITPEIVNYDGDYPYDDATVGVNREKTTSVGSLGVANRFGLYDMHGNVSEWCQDWDHENYKGAPTNGSAWESGGEQKYRVWRGGMWSWHAGRCRSAFRGGNVPSAHSVNFGVRVAVVSWT